MIPCEVDKHANIRPSGTRCLASAAASSNCLWVPKTCAAWANGGSARCAVPGGQILVRPQVG
jgi:hypothetical protein